MADDRLGPFLSDRGQVPREMGHIGLNAAKSFNTRRLVSRPGPRGRPAWEPIEKDAVANRSRPAAFPPPPSGP